MLTRFFHYSHAIIGAILCGLPFAAAASPNFVVIYADDLGYGDLGCYGAKGYETPELDQMAQEGMRFTDFSTSSSICTPSRAGLLTGRYAKRWGHNGRVFFPTSKDGMPPSEITIAEVLKQAGYQTGLVGKWHLGHQPEFLPTAQGFDLYFGIPYSNDMWEDPATPLAKRAVFNEGMSRSDYLNHNVNDKKSHKDKVPLMSGTEVIEWPVDQSLLTRRYTEKAQAFIAENKDTPFFLYLAHSMPHTPLYASEAFAGKTKRGLFGDVIEELDWSVGQILKTLRENGLEKNTLVIFTSDNGPWLSKKENAGNAGPLRDGKFSDYEGGCRVPCIAWQPGTVPAGSVCDVQTSTLDLLPTFAALAGTQAPQDRTIDGLDIRTVLTGNFNDAPKRDFFLYRTDAIRTGDWKYVQKKKSAELFDLSKDQGESKNLVRQHPEKAENLSRKLEEVKQSMQTSALLGSASGNPILKDTDPGFLYAADPAAEVFDGKVYVYCSHDQPDAKNYSSMQDYIVLESSDLKTWINHGVVLKPREYSWANGQMNAPDVAYKDGWYYFYFPYDKTHIGISKSRSPIGPWEEAVTDKITSIFDPTVIVDDDGQAYIYGNDHKVDLGDKGSHLMGAKLKDNMVELDGPWVRLSKEPVNEAVHVFKRNGIYYFHARVGKVTQYWMADSPLPQYATFKGELAPFAPSSPNHASAIEFKGQWYFFYHRGDVNSGSGCRRSACFDKMTFRQDGTIEPVVYTLEKDATLAAAPAKGSVRQEAEAFAEQSGTKVENQSDGGNSRGLGFITHGDWTGYKAINFGSNPAAKVPFYVRVSAKNQGGTIELRLDSPTGEVVGSIPVATTGGWDNYKTLSTTLSGVSGTHTLYLCYKGGSGNLFNLNWFAWSPQN
jgi:arylsulfatase A-like enzyme